MENSIEKKWNMKWKLGSRKLFSLGDALFGEPILQDDRSKERTQSRVGLLVL